jgi:hypothetical protein
LSGGGFAPFNRFGGLTSLGSTPTNLVYGEIGERRAGPRVLLPFDADLLVGGSFLSVDGHRRDGLAVLTISNISPAFATWRSNYFDAAQLADSSISGPAADPDGDGTPNLAEFAYNLHPLIADAFVITPQTGTNGLPNIGIELFDGEGRLTLEFVRRRPTPHSKLWYAIEFADDPGGPWTPGGVENLIFMPAPWERVKAVDAIPTTLLNRRFARVRVVSTE